MYGGWLRWLCHLPEEWRKTECPRNFWPAILGARREKERTPGRLGWLVDVEEDL